jgi:DNA-binding SARP family transcriptional activator/basic membrane lipoprotein Med (substrate-binding protein (PBP1-ABC) superfamily)
VTIESRLVEFRILGPLEIRVDSDVVALAGGKQRTVLAALLLRADEVVSVDRLVDELWGECPPASAAHTLEVYVSRLRQLLNGHGPALVRRGVGYVLELGGASLDSREFVALAERAARAAVEDELELVATSAREALAIWRGRVLPDLVLGTAGRAEAERLEELRLRTLELGFDAELTLGRHEQAVGELRSLVAEHPYRERFVAQLMLALYRSGRHAEALDAYEHTRRRLDADLGLQPSADLQLLSAQIVRQEQALEARTPARSRVDPVRHSTRERAGRLSGLVAVGVAVAAVMALTAAGGARQLEPVPESSTMRVALVLQGVPADDRYVARRRSEFTNAFDGLTQFADVESQLLEIQSDLAPADAAALTRRLAAGRFDLVLFALNTDGARALGSHVHELSGVRSVFIDASFAELALGGSAGATAIRFATEAPAQLAGALGGLVRPRAETSPRADILSVVVGERTSEAARVVAAFKRGVARAQPRAKVLVDYTNELLDPTACERIVNAQLDAGSDVVFVQSGRCGAGALAVARARGVWGISGDGVGNREGTILGAIFKDWDNAVYTAVAAFADGTLPAGEVVLGLDGYNVGLDMSPTLPGRLASKIVTLCSDVRLSSARTTIETRSEP